MANQTTTASDLIIPEVWGPTVSKAVIGRAVLAQFANVDSTLQGQPGDRVSVASWNYIGDADDLTEGVAMETRKLTMSDSSFTIKEAGVAVEMTDKAILTSIGDPQSQATSQIGLSTSRKIDSDLRLAAEYAHTNGGEDDEEATTSPIIVDVSGGTGAAANLTWNGAVTGAIDTVGDEWDPNDWAAFLIHSKQHTDLLRDPNFQSQDKIGGTATAIARGQIGTIAGIPVLLSNRAKVDGSGASAVYHALLLKRGAITLAYKRQAIVEKDRDILRRTTVVATNVHYGAVRTDDNGVIVIKTKSSS